jgi:hypothetical protein
MTNIITALVAEHRELLAFFERVECLLPRLETVEQVRAVAREAETALRRHGAAEEDLMLLALDGARQHRPLCNRIYTDHEEIDARLTQVYESADLAAARALLLGALAASRRHFHREEQFLFPRIEQKASPQTLSRLGAIWTARSADTRHKQAVPRR